MCAVLAAVLVCVPVAAAATAILRPDGVAATNGAWGVDPFGAAEWSVVDDALVQPTAPPNGDLLTTDADADPDIRFSVTNRTLGAGEQVTRTTAWAYTGHGPNRSMRLELLHGTTSLGSVTIPGSSQPAWRRVDSTVALTQAQVDDLRLRMSASGTSPGQVRAVYVELTTEFPPAAPSITGRPGAVGRDQTPTWTFTAGAGLGTECRLSRPGAVVFDWSACASPITPDLTLHPDASYTFSVRTKSAAGLVSSPVSDAYALDTSAPAPPTFTSSPATPTANARPTWAFVGEPGATFECELRRGATVVTPFGACSTPQQYNLSAQPDGLYTFSVRARDVAGNSGTAASSTIELNRAAPGVPSVTVTPRPQDDDPSPSFTFSASGAASYECRFTEGARQLYDWTPCGSPRTESLTLELDGTYRMTVRGVSGTGVRGAEAFADYLYDTTDPGPPSIAPSPAASANARPEWSFTAEAGATFECRLREGARPVSNWNPCTSPASYNLNSEPDGVYTFEVHAIDAAGNPSADATRTYTLDRTVPPAPTIGSGPPATGAGRTLEWTFSGAGASGFECRLQRPDGTDVVSFTPCTSPFTHTLAAGEPDGEYTFSVRGESGTGVDGPVRTGTYVLDSTRPAPPALTAEPVTPSADPSPQWSFTGESDALLECRLVRGTDIVSDWAECTSPETFDLASVVDGVYTFAVRATDAAGNVSDPATSAYDLDRTVPPLPDLDSEPATPRDGRTFAWSFSSTAPSHECRLLRPDGTPVEDWTACTGTTKSYALDAFAAQGTYAFAVRGVSTTGVRGPEATGSYTLDDVDPAPPTIGTGPASPTADQTPTWTFTGEAGARFECRLEREGVQVIGWGDCTSAHTYDLTSRSDGSYEFFVRAVDDALNEGTASSRTFVLDRAEPAQPTFDAAPGARGSGRTPTWSFSGDGATWECRVNGSTWADCASPYTHPLAGQPDGTYTLEVRGISATGVRGPSVADAYELDTAAPGAPAIVSRPGAVGSAAVALWGFTADAGAVTSCRLERDGVVEFDWNDCATPHGYDLSGKPDGTYTFLVRATDATGNVGATASDQYRLDRGAPGAPSIDSGPGPLGASRAPAWTFSGEASATFECRLEREGGAVVADWSACASPRTWDLTGAADGQHTFAVRTVDAAGNRSPEARSVYVLDTTPGALRIESGPAPLGRDRAPAWTFAGDAAARYECRLERDGIEVVAWTACTSPRGFDLNGMPDGRYRFVARAFDAAGNASAEAAATYDLDTTAPPAPVVDGRPDSPEDRSPTWRFSGEAGARFDCRVERGGVASLDWTPCASPFTADLARAEEGTHDFRVRATDAAGNTGLPAEDAFVLRLPAPAPAPKPEPKPEPKPKPKPEPTPREEPAPAPAPVRPSKRPRAKKAAVPAPAPARAPKPKRRRPAPEPRRAPKPAPAPVPAPKPKPAAEKKGGVARMIGKGLRAAADVVTEHPDKSVFPGSLILLVLGFLALQNRIDRSDPKLALAPVHADPDLEFLPPQESDA